MPPPKLCCVNKELCRLYIALLAVAVAVIQVRPLLKYSIGFYTFYLDFLLFSHRENIQCILKQFRPTGPFMAPKLIILIKD